MKFMFISLKKNILPCFFILFAICLVVFSKSNLIATKNGLLLWANNVVPSLFPFFIIIEIISHTGVIKQIGKLFDKCMRPIFNVPGEGAFAFIVGILSGYPAGGKVVANLYSQGLCTKDEAERMLAFCNNSGPLFVISFVGISLFGDTKTGLLLLLTHILASITVGIILAKHSKSTLYPSYISNKKIKASSNIETLSLKNLGKVLGQSIQNATSTILLIGGFVVIFSVLISILDKLHIFEQIGILLSPLLKILGFDINFAQPLLCGILELTNGVNLTSLVNIKSVSQNIILSAFLLGFGGISVLLQVFSIISETDLSIKKYFIGKCMQGVIASIYVALALHFIPTLSLDIEQTCATVAQTITFPVQFFGLNSYVFLLFVILFIVCMAFSAKPSKHYH